MTAPLATGFAAGKGDQDASGADAVPQLRPTNILPDGSVTFEGAKRVPLADVALTDLLKPGEVLFNNTNSPAWVGKSAVFQSREAAVCSNHVTRLRLRPGLEPRFVAEALNALQRLGYFATLATNFNNQSGINADALANVVLPLGVPGERAALLARLDAARAGRDAGLRAAGEALPGLDACLLKALGIDLPTAPNFSKPFSVRFGSIRNHRLDPHFFNHISRR